MDKEIVVNTERLKKYYHRNGQSEIKEDTEDSSDEEDNDVLGQDNQPEDEGDDPGAIRNELQEDAPAPPQDWGPQGRFRCNLREENIIEGPRRTPGREAQAPRDNPPQSTWGERGELRCNINPGNIVEGPRERSKRVQ